MDASGVLDGVLIDAGNASGSSLTLDDVGGCALVLGGAPTFRECYFYRSRADARGGGIYVGQGAAPVLESCSFFWNEGGGLTLIGAGAMRMDQCSFSSNQAVRGGAIEVVASAGVLVTNSLITSNFSTGPEGGAAFWVGSNSDLTAVNCTFALNTSEVGGPGAIRLEGSTGATVRNSIVWGNSAPPLSVGCNVSTSIVERGYPGARNLASDPLFSNPGIGDFEPFPGSPAIDAGDNSALPAGLTATIFGADRFLDDPAAPDTGQGTGPIVDLGALERRVVTFETELTCAASNAFLQVSSATGSPSIGRPIDLQAIAWTEPASGLAIYLLGSSQLAPVTCTPLPGVLGGLALDPTQPVVFLGQNISPAYELGLMIELPNKPALVGKQVFFQALLTDLHTLIPEFTPLVYGTIVN